MLIIKVEFLKKFLKWKKHISSPKNEEINYFEFSGIFLYPKSLIKHEQWLLVLEKVIFNQINYPCAFLSAMILLSSSCKRVTGNLFLLFVVSATPASYSVTWPLGHYGHTTTANTAFEFFVSLEGKAEHQDNGA